jgi:hypothetical protein
VSSVFVSHDRAQCSQFGAPVGKEVGAIESWLGHSESIIVYFALMVGARSGVSRSKMRGVRPVVSSRQVGGRPEVG